MKNKYDEFFDEKIEYAISSKKSITELAIEFGIERHIVSKYLRKRGFITNLHGKLPINDNIFKVIDNEHKAYWLGFLYADGNVHLDKKKHHKIELTLKESDLTHLEKFRDFISSSNKIAYRKKAKAYRISFCNDSIGKDLISLGCFIKKSNILKFPTIEQVPKELQKHFVRGYLDGDGSIVIYKRNDGLALTTCLLGTKEFLEGVKSNLNLPDNKLTVTNKGSLANCFTLQYANYHSVKILEYLYKESTIYLERKYNKYLEAMKLFKEKSERNFNKHSKMKIKELNFNV